MWSLVLFIPWEKRFCAMVPHEEEKILKRRARTRLLGAMVLAMLSFAFVFWLEKRFPQQNQNPPPSLEIPEETPTPLPPEDETSKAMPPPGLPLGTAPQESKPAPSPPSPPPPLPALDFPKSKPQTTGHFMVQLGVYSDVQNARKVQSRARALGIATKSERIQSGGRPLVRLRTSTYDSLESAEKARSRLEEAGIPAMVVRVP